ncbi:MAG: hypothetical protein WB870_04940 [Gallionellaceae bacterium]
MNNTENVIEYGCANCGAHIRIAPKTGFLNTCDECNTQSAPLTMARFQCLPNTLSLLYRLCTTDELKQLRLNPNSFDFSELNTKLVGEGKQELQINSKSEPPTVSEKRRD